MLQLHMTDALGLSLSLEQIVDRIPASDRSMTVTLPVASNQ